MQNVLVLVLAGAACQVIHGMPRSFVAQQGARARANITGIQTDDCQIKQPFVKMHLPAKLAGQPRQLVDYVLSLPRAPKSLDRRPVSTLTFVDKNKARTVELVYYPFDDLIQLIDRDGRYWPFRLDKDSRQEVDRRLTAMLCDVPAIVGCLKDNDPSVNQGAAQAVFFVANSGASTAKDLMPTVPHLVNALAHTHSRLDAAKALLAIEPKDTKAFAAVESLLKDTRGEEKMKVLWSLAYLSRNASELLPLVVPILHDDSDVWVRRAGFSVVHNLGEDAERIIGDVIKLTRDPDPEIRYCAIRAIWVMKAKGAPAIPALIARLQDEDYNVPAAMVGLENLAKDAISAIPALMELLKSSKPGVRIRSARAVLMIDPKCRNALSLLIDELRNKDDEHRGQAAEALGSLGTVASDALPALMKATGDESGWVRFYATNAVRRINDKPKTDSKE